KVRLSSGSPVAVTAAAAGWPSSPVAAGVPAISNQRLSRSVKRSTHDHRDTIRREEARPYGCGPRGEGREEEGGSRVSFAHHERTRGTREARSAHAGA